MRNQGIEVFSIAPGENPDMGEMNAIASDPDSEHVYTVREHFPWNQSDGQTDKLMDRWTDGLVDR